MKGKLIGGIVLGLIAIVVIVLVFVISNLDAIVAKAIEIEGGKVTGTEVGVSGVKIKITDGSGAIDNLTIANPEGFAGGNAFSLGNITLDLDMNSLRGDPIVIDEILVSAPVASAVLNEKGLSNIDALRQHILEYTASIAGPGGGAEAASTGPEKKIRIRKFIFEKGRVEVDASVMGIEKSVLDLPAFEVSDIGGEDGALPDQIAKEVLLVYTKKVTSEFARSELRKLVEKQLGGSLEEKAKDTLKNLIK